MIKLDLNNLENSLKEARMQLNDFERKMNAIISPFNSENLNEKKSIELCQTGKFLVKLEKHIQILKHTESPDIIISYKNQIIGLEHERIFVNTEVQKIKSIEQLLKKAAKDYKKQYPHHTMLATCYLKTNDFSFKTSEIPQLKQEICNYIAGLKTKQDVNKPHFIKEIDIREHTDIEFLYNVGGYCASTLNIETLTEGIRKKEDLIEKYKSNTNDITQWLLIVIESLSPDSYDFDESLLKHVINSKFDRVYVMEDFKANVYRVV